MCRATGKSAVELQHLDAARSVFGNAASGQPMRSRAFVSRRVWHPDITVALEGGRTLVVEYDGAYWHAGKAEIDLAKTRDLLATGALVVRCREHPLPSLPVTSENYLEMTVYSTAPDAPSAMRQIVRWCAAGRSPKPDASG